MKTIKSALGILAIATLTLTSCKKDKDTDIDKNRSGEIALHFDNRAGNLDLYLNTVTYQNALSEDLTISKFDYYISNIKLLDKDGSTYTYPKDQSYFLVKENNLSTQDITLSGVPEGDYTGVTFTIGIDSQKSVSPITERTGVLDPSAGASGMYWMWNSGYIFMKMEGTSPSAPLDSASGTRPFQYHIGLFGGYSTPTVNNVKEVTLSFGGSTANVRKTTTDVPEVHIYVDALKVLNGAMNISIASNPVVMVTPYSANISNNYKDMFKFDHIH